MDGAGVSRAARRFAAVLAVASPLGAAYAQQCYFEIIAAQPPSTFSTSTLVRVAYDSVRGRILLVDSPPSPALTKLYTWTGSAWSLLSANGPPGRSDPAIAFDSARDRLVYFGGLLSGYPVDVWEWDGGAWSVRTPASGPPGRRWHAMAFDSVRARVVLFGGLTIGNQHLDDTWTWDGNSWELQSPGGPRPVARREHSMTFDSHRGLVVLYGGIPAAGIIEWEFWEWDGTAWVQRLPAPLARRNAGLCFDPVRARLTVMGGNSFRDVWEFNNATGQWVRIVDFPTSISGDSTLLFDPAIGRPVLCLGSGLRVWHAEGSIFAPIISQQPFFGGAYCPGSGAAISFEAPTLGGGPLAYRWHRNGQALVNGWNISGADTRTMFINPVTLADAGSYTMVVTNPCGPVTSNAATLTVPTSGCSPAPCYANCDASLVAPFLTANDFACFLDAFAAGHPYANCDGSTALPTLTGNDFQCFLDRFVAGCP